MILRVDGQSIPLDESQTGEFPVKGAELQAIILWLLRRIKSRQCSQRFLFGRLCSHLGIRASGQARDKLLKVFMDNVRKLRDAGKVELVSGKTHLNIRLVTP